MLNYPEATQQALNILRSGENFNWHLITLAGLVTYVYFNEISKKNWKGIAAGLSLYAVHWFFEIANSLIQYFTGHALWIVPSGTSLLLLIGVGAEISLGFSIAGLIFSKILLEDPKGKILGINNRLFIGTTVAAGFGVLEIFLVKTPGFHWVYPWWGSFPVFLFVYIPFFVTAMFAYDWQPKNQIRFIGGLAALDAFMLFVFGGLLGWI